MTEAAGDDAIRYRGEELQRLCQRANQVAGQLAAMGLDVTFEIMRDDSLRAQSGCAEIIIPHITRVETY